MSDYSNTAELDTVSCQTVLDEVSAVIMMNIDLWTSDTDARECLDNLLSVSEFVEGKSLLDTMLGRDSVAFLKDEIAARVNLLEDGYPEEDEDVYA